MELPINKANRMRAKASAGTPESETSEWDEDG